MTPLFVVTLHWEMHWCPNMHGSKGSGFSSPCCKYIPHFFGIFWMREFKHPHGSKDQILTNRSSCTRYVSGFPILQLVVWLAIPTQTH